MNLYIQIKNGEAFEHPIYEDNFLQAFPEIDINNLPPQFARFRRIEPQDCGLTNTDPTKRLEIVSYKLGSDGFWEDVCAIVDKTEEEIAAYRQSQINRTLPLAITRLNNLKTTAQEIYATLTDDSEKNAWDTYFSMLPTEEPQTHDINIPKYPIKNEQGKYVPNLDSTGNWEMRILHNAT